MATAKKASKEDDATGEAKPKKKLTLIIAIVALLLVGGLGGGAAWHFLGNKTPAEGEGKAESEPPKPPVFSALDPFVVNLQPEMGEQYLQVAMTLQVPEQTQADQIKLYMPMIRSRLLVLLSSKQASALMSPDGKAKLAEEIIATLNEPFTPGAPSLGVSSVFFTAFVIQ
jgi:flagellar FliL protein